MMSGRAWDPGSGPGRGWIWYTWNYGRWIRIPRVPAPRTWREAEEAAERVGAYFGSGLAAYGWRFSVHRLLRLVQRFDAGLRAGAGAPPAPEHDSDEEEENETV